MARNVIVGSTTNRKKIQQHLRNFTLKTLFVEELGWDVLREPPLVVTVDGIVYTLRSLVEKRGVKVFVADPAADGHIPADSLLRKIEREVTRQTAYEQFIIFIDAAREQQVWLWVKREHGKRAASRLNRYHKGQSGELLAQKLERLAVRMDEEERLNMTEVVGRVARAFDVERVTKKFYDRFKLEHTAFLKLIQGSNEQADREWYASLMLNRLMFIYCYSFLPADGVERLIRLRARVQERLRQNAEVVGTDEVFFEDEFSTARLLDLYNEKAGILDDEVDNEVDLASQAYQIWKNAIEANPKLKNIIEQLPDVIFSTRAHRGSAASPEGALVYIRTSEGNDALAWVNCRGESVTQSQLTILRAAACAYDTPSITRPPEQHELVKCAVEHIIAEEMRSIGGQLGSVSGARYKTYTRLKTYIDATQHTLFPPSPDLHIALEELYKYPLQETARDTLNRQLRSGVNVASLVIDLRADNRLCQVQEQQEPEEPRIICSLGLFNSLDDKNE